jgi:hypothetical protein
MKIIKITDDFFKKYKEGVEFDKSLFDTDQEIEVRIPFDGYYSLKVKCKDPQVAMTEVLKANRDIGIMSIVGGNMEEDGTHEEDTYAIICKK